jgi:hypothetical protein
MFGQATRTWVSGVGDDANPCSRTAPCKTFAGAISKTAAKGEINVLDPGGFGGVTITKAITISAEGVEAGVLVSGTNAIIINAGAADDIVLRGLDIEGLSTGLNGINFLAGRSLHVENCTINDFSQAGINVAPTTGNVRVFVTDSIIRNNNPVGGSSFGGIFIHPTSPATVRGTFENVRVAQNFHGIRLQGASNVSMRNSSSTENTGNGVLLITPSATRLNLDGCNVSGNGNGIRSEGAGSIVRIANTLITDNSGSGLFQVSSGLIDSFGNNRIEGNGTNGSPNAPLSEN